MDLVMYGFIGGAVIVVLLFMLKGIVKLFVPQRVGPTLDDGFDRSMRFVGRWVGRALVLFALGMGLYIWWLVKHGA